MSFLKGLRDTYNSIKTQILLMEPLPGINKVFSLALHQERQERTFSDAVVIESKIMTNNASQSSKKRNISGWKGNGRGRGKQCSFCNKMNLTADECYSKHGYPPWIKQRIAHAATNAVENLEEHMVKKKFSTR